MRAAVFGETGGISVVERELPDLRPGWVRLAVSAVGICGSDLNLLYAHGDTSAGVQPGHEVTGVVATAGDGVALAAGTPVALEPIIGCGRCNQCLRGAFNLCPAVRLFGFARPGGMAELVQVPADNLHVLPEDLPAHVAALVEPVAVCVRGLRLADIDLGEKVAVLGCGSIGLISILLANSAGAGEVYATARYPHQQALARAFGATAVFGNVQDLLQAVGDQHVDLVVETVGGHAETLAEAVQVARPGGRILVLGVFDGAPTLPGLDLFRKELTLSASNCYGRERRHGDFAVAVRMTTRYRRELEALVTHRFKLDQVAEAFATAADKSTRSIKVQVEP
jgi:threonine dehydrogenase-like Zn-dependent dehydrogenase